MFVDRLQSSSSTPLIASNANGTSDMDNRHISPAGMLAVKIYAFGGLAFMICVILFALGNLEIWVWTTVLIRRE
jgi:hypothetical protein